MKTQTRLQKPTIKDIANACGVSTATVSYVLNGKSVLRADTRERVYQAMRDMNYHPNALARGLHTKTMRALGIMLGTVDPSEFVVNPYTSRILQGVVQEARRQKFHVTLFTDDWLGADASGPSIRDGRTDGILVVAPILGTDIMDTLPEMQPNIVAISAPARPFVDIVDVDDFAGGRLATEHLINLGHRRIAYLTGNSDLSSYQPRLAGYLAALDVAGIEPDNRLIVESHFDGSLAGAQTKALLELPERPTAIFAGNDAIAFQTVSAIRDAGLSVPEDVSVVGYDDMPAASVVTPKLTTINQPLVEIGVTATTMLIERIAASESSGGLRRKAENVLLAPKLVVRDSTGPLARR
ncbi:MAG TPA: LacI family DNA-binding transcriptional regulator [Capsulimonadaceae bacterium]|jgi:LacI family transcriptional regulator